MSSYIYMKILESRPSRYDRGISLLSLGRIDRVKRRIVDELVEPGARMLEIGCGTGTMAAMAAGKGATVLGFDVSNDMLMVARDKIEGAELGELVELWEMGVSGMDKLEDNSFDLVASTLVFSELWLDEIGYALTHAHRVLKPGGRLALADEVKPKGLAKRLAHAAIRLPLFAVTYALTQTSTSAVDGLPEAVAEAGFEIETRELTSMDSFLYLVAKKGKE